jgi:hypothetical protein
MQAMEHHVLDRPRIATSRRNPSVVKLEFVAEPAALRPPEYPASAEASDPHYATVYLGEESQIKENNLSSGGNTVPANEPKQRFTGQQNFRREERQQSENLKLPPRVPPRENIYIANGVVSNMNKIPDNAHIGVTGSRKWAKVLGFPLDEKSARAEKKRIEKLARKRGAKKDQIIFMIEQIIPVEQQEFTLLGEKQSGRRATIHENLQVAALSKTDAHQKPNAYLVQI